MPDTTPPRPLRLDVAGGPVHVADWGGDGPPLVLVHGLGGSHVNWSGVAPLLRQRFHVYAPDLLGFGRTPLAGRRATVPGHRRLLDGVLAGLGDGPVILAGNSMGGLVSIFEAAEAPHRVAGLVLVDPAQPAPLGVRPDRLVAGAFAVLSVPAVGEVYMRRRARRVPPERLVEETLTLCTVDRRRIPAAVYQAELAMARERRATPEYARAFIESARSILRTMLHRGRFTEQVLRITAPTLVVHGERDRLVPVAASRALLETRPDWRLEVLDDCGHVPMMEWPERFTEVVCGWLDGDGAAAMRTARGGGAVTLAEPADRREEVAAWTA